MRVYSFEMRMKSFNLQSWKYFRRKIFYQIFDENFFFWNHFTNQRSNLYWKWRKWLMWGEHERTNEWKFKNIRIKGNRKIRITRQIIKKKTRKLWKWIVIWDNFFIISRIINWVTSQFLNINFKSGSRTTTLSKVEFIVMGAALTMFLVKLMFLLYLSSVVSGIYFGMHLYVDGFLTMVLSKQIFFLFFNLFIFSI